MALTKGQRTGALKDKKITMTKLADDLGCSVAHISKVISGAERSRRVQDAVAAAIGMPVGEVFDVVGEAATE